MQIRLCLYVCAKTEKIIFYKGRNTRDDNNTLLQQIALCVLSNDKSYALIAAVACSDKSPGVNASTFGGRLLRILSLQHVVQNPRRQNFSIKFCSHDEICCCDVLLRRVAAIFRLVCSGLWTLRPTSRP